MLPQKAKPLPQVCNRAWQPGMHHRAISLRTAEPVPIASICLAQRPDGAWAPLRPVLPSGFAVPRVTARDQASSHEPHPSALTKTAPSELATRRWPLADDAIEYMLGSRVAPQGSQACPSLLTKTPGASVSWLAANRRVPSADTATLVQLPNALHLVLLQVGPPSPEKCRHGPELASRRRPSLDNATELQYCGSSSGRRSTQVAPCRSGRRARQSTPKLPA